MTDFGTLPQSDFVKINSDACSQIERRSRVGALIRDENNTIKATLFSSRPLFGLILAEILAIRDRLCLASQMGFPKVVAESNSLEVFNLIADVEVIHDELAS